MTHPRGDREGPPEPWQPPPLNTEDVHWLRTNLAPAQPLPTQRSPAPEPVSPPRARLDWWLKGPGIMLVIVVGGLLVALLGQLFQSGTVTTAAAEAKVVECAVDGSTLAVVTLTVRNTGDATATFAVDLVYRDSDGSRVDTDTAYAREVPPGETVRLQESTVLDMPVTNGRCEIAAVH